MAQDPHRSLLARPTDGYFHVVIDDKQMIVRERRRSPRRSSTSSGSSEWRSNWTPYVGRLLFRHLAQVLGERENSFDN